MIRRVAVIVPAANEQERIAASLRAIERARQNVLTGAYNIDRVEVFVVLDACTDRTPDVVGRFAQAHGTQVLTSTARCVGSARAQGAAAAIATLAPPSTLWLANTDADSEVPPNWLTTMVALTERGAQLVLGTVLPGDDLPLALRASWVAEHRVHDGHPHVHGANFGIRADTYHELGGWAALRNDEDVELVDRAVATRARIVRAGAIPVVTSARMVGRAPNGFSSYLRHLRDHHAAPRPTEHLAG